MVACGVDYGLVTTAGAYIYLRIPCDSYTVFYYAYAQSQDVDDPTGFDDPSNRLHVTAVGQVPSFTVLSL